MEIYERIKYLRKSILKLSQEKFGTMLGVNRSVIKNIELNVLVKPEQKEPLYKLICKVFNVCENWLYTGEGGDEAMFESRDNRDIVSLAQKYDFDDVSVDILVAYFTKLSVDERKRFSNVVKLIARAIMEGDIDNLKGDLTNGLLNHFPGGLSAHQANHINKAINDSFDNSLPHIPDVDLPINARSASKLDNLRREQNERGEDILDGLTEDEHVALIRQRYADAKKGAG